MDQLDELIDEEMKEEISRIYPMLVEKLVNGGEYLVDKGNSEHVMVMLEYLVNVLLLNRDRGWVRHPEVVVDSDMVGRLWGLV